MLYPSIALVVLISSISSSCTIPIPTHKAISIIKGNPLTKIENLITTEKDIVKLPNEFLQKHHIFTLRICHDIDDKESFLGQIKS